MDQHGKSPLSFGRRELIATIVGVLLYAGISWLTNIFPLTAAEGVDIRPGVAVPIFFGLVFGPVVGFVVGLAGNFLSDLWTGWLVYPPDPATGNLLLDLTQGYLLNWQAGSGLMGLVAGLATFFGRRYRTLADHVRALAFSALGIVVGMGFAALTDIWLDGLTFDFVLTQYLIPAVQVNLLNTVILVPILLFNYEHLDLGSLAWWRSALMRRLLLGILVSAALPVALLGLFLTQQATSAAVGQ
ncbi:MAG: ECF transporter S component, partial [Chloroflexi bacterium]|nr:ECF transporter S component [Chloroflexota bacterium]